MPNDDKLQDDQLPPTPNKNDIVVRGDRATWPLNACVDNYRGSDYGYRQGYRKAGLILAEWVNQNVSEQDSLVFPIVHNYRHHLELMLKRLIRTGGTLLNRELTTHESGTLDRHKLDELWTVVAKILAEVCQSCDESPPPKEELAGIKSYVKQIAEVDPESYSFRYATSRKGEPSISGISHLNILVFANCMEKLCGSLDRIDSQFMYWQGLHDEMYSGMDY